MNELPNVEQAADLSSRSDTPPACPTAIIGIGCLFPQADGLRRFWANIQNGVDAITDVPPTHWRPEEYFDPDPKKPDHTYAHRGGFLAPADFPPLEFGVTPNSLEATDTTQLLGLLAAKQALADAGYGPGRDFDRKRVSVILGVTGTLELVIPLGARLGHPKWRQALAEAGVAPDVADEVVRRIADSYVGWQEDSFPGLLGNVVAGRIANRLDLGGTNCVVDAACASSLSALHLALLELAAGRCDLALSGGMDTFNDIFMYMCFSKTPALSPTGNAKPFDTSADGTILGEGLGCLVLKRLADAERDGDRIYAVIRGVGTSSDGKGHAIYAPSSAGQTKALRQAYHLAQVTPDTIELVEAHGTGTRAGDAAELAALTEVYSEATSPTRSASEGIPPWCALGSVKSQIGHTKAAAGAAGLIKAALALYHKVLPPTIKVTQPVEALAARRTPFYANTVKRPWLPRPQHPRRAAVSAFGFGGSNFHCVLEEYRPAKPEIDWDDAVQIAAFAADDRAAVFAVAAAWLVEQPWDAVCRAAAQTRAAFAANRAHRLVLVLERDRFAAPRLLSTLQALAQREAEKTTWSSPEGIYYGSGPAAGTLALLFPGQGSQYPGMLRDLACCFPQAQQELAAADACFGGADGQRLSDLIYPPPAFRDEDREHDDARLRATDVAQPALGAVSLAALRVLDLFGVRPAAFAGHSYGELVALCAAGRIDAAALHHLSKVRGRLMAEAAGADGAMLAVAAPLPRIQELLQAERLDLTIANRNAPNQSVLSGRGAEVERAADACARHGLTCRQLAVSAAFHSPLVAAVRQPFAAALEAVEFRPAGVPVFANPTAAPYPADAAAARRLLAGQLAEPVAFVDEIEQLYQAGVRTFLEVGPGNKLTGLVGAILASRDHEALAVDASSGKRSGAADLARALAQLAAAGQQVELARWNERDEEPARAEKKPALTVPICGANYVMPKQPRPTPPPPPVAAAPRPSEPPAPPAPAPRGVNGNAPHGHGQLVPAAPPPAPAAPAHGALGDALRMTQENLLALQRLGEQTAQLHRQFLDGQDRTLQVFQGLLEQQQRLLHLHVGGAAPLPSIAPAPVALPPTTTNGHYLPPAPVAAAPAPVPAPVVQTARLPAEPAGATPAPRQDRGRAVGVLLAVVSEKTGYPAEMLELDMELDADLGIDSIKRVEIFTALQERLPEAPPVKSEHLGTLRTLRHVADFLADAPVAPAAQPAGAPPAPRQGDATPVLLAVVSEKTGYPAEMLELDMELDADLGIDSIKRVEIFTALQERLPEAPPVKSEHLGTLRTLRHVADFLAAQPVVQAARLHSGSTDKPPAPRPEPTPALQRWLLTRAPLDENHRPELQLSPDGDIWVTDDGAGLAAKVVQRLGVLGFRPRLLGRAEWRTASVPPTLVGLVLTAPCGALTDPYPWEVFQLVQSAAAALRQSGRAGAALLATVARLDGAFGLSGRWQGDAAAGGLAGLTKTAHHEWPEVHCKALDVAADWDDAEEAALAVVGELLLVGPTEVGLSPQGRCTLRLQEAPPAADAAAPLARGDVVVVTGGARGVTAETAVALAEAFAPTLVLLGRSPAPEPEPVWLAAVTDEADIKRALLAQAGGKATPKELQERYQRIQANREALRTLERIRQADARAEYHQADVRDDAAVRATLAEVTRTLGPVRGLVHGAGVLADRLIEDKTEEQFQQVYGTKVAGLNHLLAALPDGLKVLALFSSSTGRFGRTGQADYAIANEVLNKTARQQAALRPGCRVVALNWGPWDGGMVTPGLRRVFAAEGVGVIPLRAGADFFVRELRQAGGPVEVVVLGPGSGLVQDAAPTARPQALAAVFERQVTVEQFPVLRAHVLDHRAVLPMALMVEWLAHAALHGHPGLAFHGFDQLRVLKGVIVNPAQPPLVRVLAGPALQRDGRTVVPVELHGQGGHGRDLLHARAEVVLVPQLPAAPAAAPAVATQPYPHTQADLYPGLLFHELVEGCSAAGVVGRVATAPAPAAWIRQPLRPNWLADPLALDSAFQLMVVWSRAAHGVPSLPCFAGEYRQYRRNFPRGGVRVVARVTLDLPHRALADIDFVDEAGALVARLRDYECTLDASLTEAFRRHQLPQPALPLPSP
jgi:acyl transferase domain-containing protein/NAD(P)-dependent dehydrogenase (short-subunit alcohol dehydrogenase family)/acyl carrier protein